MTDPAAETLDKIARNVLRKNGIEPDSISLIQGDSIKTVWKVTVQKRNLCLKRLKQSLDKAQFSVNAQIHIRKSGGKVPEVILSKEGGAITEYNGQLFVLYEWIDGKDLNFENPADLKKAIQGLAAFHLASKGYLPGDGCRISIKSGKWPDQYRSMLNRMTAWKEEAANKSSRLDHAAYLKSADRMVDAGNSALKALGASSYEKLTREGSGSIVLCHQDFGRGNVLESRSGIFILDLDGVTFDLPARDLRKLAGKNAQAGNRWEASAIDDILGWYTAVFPLSREEKEVFYIDMLFPHWFFGLVKNLFQNGKALKPAEIERTARLEESKTQVIKALLNRSE